MEGSAKSERGFAAWGVVNLDGCVGLLYWLLVVLLLLVGLLLGVRRLVGSLICGAGLFVGIPTIGLIGVSAVVFRFFPKSFHPYQQLQLLSPSTRLDFCSWILTQVLLGGWGGREKLFLVSPCSFILRSSESCWQCSCCLGFWQSCWMLLYPYYPPQFLAGCCMLYASWRRQFYGFSSMTLMGSLQLKPPCFWQSWALREAGSSSCWGQLPFFLCTRSGPQSVFSLFQPMEKELAPPGAWTIFLLVFPSKLVQSATFLLIIVLEDILKVKEQCPRHQPPRFTTEFMKIEDGRIYLLYSKTRIL